MSDTHDNPRRKQITVVLDNAGGVILKSGRWAGYWSNASDAAETLGALLDGADPATWETDEDALDVECNMEQVRSGGCQELSAESWNDVLDVLDPDSGWTSEKKLRENLLAIRASK